MGNSIIGPGTGETISSLCEGVYTLLITEKVSKCWSDYSQSVAKEIVLPVATANSDPSSNCGIAANGQLHGLANGIKSGFRFNWYLSDMSAQLPDMLELVIR